MFDADLQHRESRIDRLQIAALCGLMLLGTLFVYSATMVSESAGLAPWYNQKLVPANRVVPARNRRRGGLVLRGLSHRRAVVNDRLLGCRAVARARIALRHSALRGAALVRPRRLQPAALRVCQARLHPGAGPFPEPSGRGIARPAHFLESPGLDAAAVRLDSQGTRPRLGAGAVADRIGHAVCGRNAQTLSRCGS